MVSFSSLWRRRKEIGRAALLVAIGLVTVNQTVLEPARRVREKEQTKASGLAAYDEPASFWKTSPLRHVLTARQVGSEARFRSVGEYIEGSSGGGGGASVDYARVLPLLTALPSQSDQQESSDRKIVRNTSLEIVVANPREATNKIHTLAVRLGGYMVTSQVTGADANSASISIRVPVNRAEEATEEIRKLALRIESDRTEAEDVTRQYVDTEARLRNLRAAEQQFLQVFKRATTVKDILEVNEKLAEVRGQIEQVQADYTTLVKRVETVAISVSLRAEADVQVLGLHWRPLFRAKLALRDAADAVGDYAATMFGFVLQIPVIALWLVTVVAFAALGWKILRWASRRFFGWPKRKEGAT